MNMRKRRILFIVLLFIPGFYLESNSQNVGIGIPSPAEKLHVAGNIKGDTIKPAAIKLVPDAGIGKILTSDASGNASWQARTGNVGFGVWGDCATNGNVTEYVPVSDSTAVSTDFFGVSVAISGNFAIIGAFSDGDIGGPEQGSASIYQFNGSNWVLMQKLLDPGGATGDSAGISVSISGNFAIVGSYTDDGPAGIDQGSAVIYQFNGTSWVFMQKIFDATGSPNDRFGISVSVSGNRAIIGSYFDDGAAGIDQGSASIYQFNGSSWVLMQKITDATGALNDNFGFSVAVSGDHALVGAQFDDGVAGSDQGSVSFFRFNGASWVLTQKNFDANAGAGDLFGNSVSISNNYAVIGAYANDTTTMDQGTANIYFYNGTNWVLTQKLAHPDGEFGDSFGISVSISGNYILVGCYNDNGPGGTGQGSATIYQRIGSGWQKLQLIMDPAGSYLMAFGYAVAIDGSTQRFVAGSPVSFNLTGKAVFGKVN
jgi:hypothetical protein